VKIIILDAHETLFDGVVSEATLPVTDGQMTVMDDHEPMFFVLGPGAISLKSRSRQLGQKLPGSGGTAPLSIRRGMARMRANELLVLVE
jgi:F0F1-type ATP synthase epsilon subunit